MDTPRNYWGKTTATVLGVAATVALVSILFIYPPQPQPAKQAATVGDNLGQAVATSEDVPNVQATAAPYTPMQMTTTRIATTSPTLQSIEASPQNPDPTPEVIRRVAFGSWRYDAFKDRRGNPFATISYNADSAAATLRYAADNRKLAEQLASKDGPVEVYVTFRSYVEPEKFSTWFNSSSITNGLTTRAYATMRMIGENGDRITGAIGLDGTTAPVVAQWPGAKVAGAIFVRGWIDRKRLANLLNDPLVFLVDVTPNIVRADLSKNGVDVSKARIQVIPESPFWNMEDLGLDNFRQ